MYTIKRSEHLDIIEVEFKSAINSTSDTYDCIYEVGEMLNTIKAHGLLINTLKINDIDPILTNFKVGLEVQFMLMKKISIAVISTKEESKNHSKRSLVGSRVLLNIFTSRDKALDWLLRNNI